MMLKDIMERFDALAVFEKRSAADKYCELVFYSKDTAAWEKILTDILGVPMKPPLTKPGKEDVLLAGYYGGIQNGQTLFKKNLGTSVIIAMFWPWQDREHTTLKIAINP